MASCFSSFQLKTQLNNLFLNIKSNKSIWLILAIFCFVSHSTNGQNSKKEAEVKPVTWISFEQAVKTLTDDPKPFLIDVYTDWCGWCKVMDKNTFSNAEVSTYLNKNFHSVKLNAETRDTIRLGEKIFTFKQEYKSNELAISLLGGKMSYPSVVFLDSKLQMLTVVPGYMEAPQMMEILKYFGEGIYLRQKWEEYQQTLRK